MLGKKILLLCFFSGMVTTTLQMSISRILAPYFGSSLLVWTLIIGSLMAAMSLGSRVGGTLSDRDGNLSSLCDYLIFPSLFMALIPPCSKPLFDWAQTSMENQAPTLFIPLLIFIALFSLPMVFFSMCSPFSIKILAKNPEESGKITGKINSLVALGSLIGLYIPLYSVNIIGSRGTMVLFSVGFALLAALFHGGGLRIGLVLLIGSLSGLFSWGTKMGNPNVVYETESPYHYIQVHQRSKKVGDEERVVTQLVLNEGNATHSVHYSWQPWVYGVWDYFSTLPFILKGERESLDIAIIGMAAGTISNQLQSEELNLKNLHIDGVEIDPKIPDVARKYFDLNEKNLKVHVMDGRLFLEKNKKTYDLIFCDAYKQPYIPFHLTTQEYFALLKSRLKPGGLMAINVGSVSEDKKIVRMIYDTILSVFPYLSRIRIVNKGGPFRNFVVIAGDRELKKEDFSAAPPDTFFFHLGVIEKEFKNIKKSEKPLILTDDLAPVELFTEMMIFEVIGDIVKEQWEKLTK